LDEEIRNVEITAAASPERVKNPADSSHVFENKTIAERYYTQEENGNPHFNPGSVLVATIGTDFPGNCKELIHAMILYTREAGYSVKYQEMQVYHNTFPQPAHASTRNHAINSGRIGGSDYICFVDTDVIPEEDTLVKLLKHEVSVIGPYVIDPEDGTLLGGPQREKDSGIHLQKWVAQCFLLIKTGVFHNTEIHFASDEAEDIFSQRIHLYGLTQYVDSGIKLKLASPPGRPDSKNWDNRMEGLKERYNKTPIKNYIEIDPEVDMEGAIQQEFLAKLGIIDMPNKMMVKEEVND
jgi:hypothetical protein